MRLIFDDETTQKKEWEAKFEEAARVCLANEGITEYSEISISFVDDEEIQMLNRNFRQNDKVTDVLSFPMYEGDDVAVMSERIEKDRVKFNADDMYLPLGDVVICEAQAKRQAEEYGHSYEREVVYLFVHSILHLLGYDHMTEEDKSVMRAQEEIVMKELNLPRVIEE